MLSFTRIKDWPLGSQVCLTMPSEGRLSKRIRLAFLSPKLVTAILDGTTGQELTIKKLSARDIPLNWEEQHVRLLC